MKANGRWLGICLSLILATWSLTACNRSRSVEAAGEQRSTSVTAQGRDFMTKAAQMNLQEIDVARAAMNKSSNSDVKDYANMIQSDHSGALEDLSNLMKDKNVPEPNSLPPDVQQDISRMNSLSGPEFDREFINMMVSDHQKAIELFRDEQTAAQNSDVKKYAEDVLPKLQMHLDKAQQLQSKLFSTPNNR